ncbi:MAG: CPBP family intramembrane metalloprotease [Roseburia sp.]|nr:CPBP family intramembrane metalloprotease [Roseburia sp.]MCM1097530.1 CPBP family intramembrane metalloprotease [Ruminococcus flavefaciens]
MLLDLSGFTDISASYQAVAETQYAANILLGLIVYVVVGPIAEELLFRGVIYNCMKGLFQPVGAVLVASVFFGVYHGNTVQGVYGFLMSCLIIYAYEYFGDFRVAVAMHAVINLVSYLLGNTPLAATGFVCWPLCVLFLAGGGACLFLLHKQKKVLGNF